MAPEATDEELGIPEGLDPNIRAELRKSRELARENESLKAQNAEATREAAFAKAAIPDSPLGQMFAKAYEGPTDDPEAIKAAFQAIGGDTGGPVEPTEAELAEQRRVAQLGTGSTGGGDVRFEDAINSAKNVDEVMALLANAPEGATDHDGRRIGAPRID
jgi:hypothetical protein